MRDALSRLWLAHDGAVPPADLTAACFGAGAAERLARGAESALAEARLRACLGAMERRGRAGAARGAMSRLSEAASFYRREALSARL